MELLNRESPMDLRFNETTKGFIDLYARRRKDLSSRVLGLAPLYFPLIEESFDKHGIPLELKYLAIVESALNPKARSRAGAVGLWQFMYSTGKMYGLKITSYVDERMDPYKSTEAAAKYLKYLYTLYDDWNMALAAYNSGPGNVNKAIRRSGGRKDYWSIRPFLPRETRSYVPAFIAVNYIMNHAGDHNIYPEACQYSYFACDTLNISKQLRFDQLSAFTGMSMEEIAQLNPTYKTGIIPENGRKHTLCLPKEKIGVFLANEDSIYEYKKEEIPEEMVVPERDMITYRVRSGDVLGVIAQRHGVSVRNLREWNNLRGTTIYPGQKLIIYTSRKRS
jgi:membrane-bound lytic murein transglycosylase D